MISRRLILWFVVIAFFVGALGSIAFNKYLIPWLSNLPGFSGITRLSTNAPIIINRREEVQINEGVNLIELAKQANNITLSIYSGTDNRLLGNGFLLSSDGLVFTSKEVVANQTAMNAVLNDGRVFPATVRALDPKSELAVMTIPVRDLAVAQFEDAASLQVGQRVAVLGKTDREFTRKFSTGFVVKTVYNHLDPNKIFSSEALEETIETDALIDSGFVGGPVINLSGRVIGMIASQNGKILISESMEPALRSYLEQGKIMRPYLGIRYTVITQSQANIKRLPEPGALVFDVEPNSPAARAGLAKNDLITQMNGQKIIDASLEHLIDKNYLSDVRLTIIRGGARQEITIKPEIR